MSESSFSDKDFDCQTYETVGRLYECLDIEMLIESGGVSDLNELLVELRKNSKSLSDFLKLNGPKGARTLTPEEFERARLETARHMELVAFDHKKSGLHN